MNQKKNVIIICNTAYHVLLTESLIKLGLISQNVIAVISTGGQSVERYTRKLSELQNAEHLAIPFYNSKLKRILWTLSNIFNFPNTYDEILKKCDNIIIFNDLLPISAMFYKKLKSIGNANKFILSEDGIGLYRDRNPRFLAIKKIFKKLIFNEFYIGNRIGESDFVDSLIISKPENLSKKQLEKQVESFDFSDVMKTIKQSDLDKEIIKAQKGQKIWLFMGQPFVEDGVLEKQAMANCNQELNAKLKKLINKDDLAVYKPHPREVSPEDTANEIFGNNVRVLHQNIPMELITLEADNGVAISYSSSGISCFEDNFSKFIIANCFEEFGNEAVSSDIYDNVTVINNLDDLK